MRAMTNVLRSFILLAVMNFALTAQAKIEKNPKKLLEAAETIRNPQTDYRVDIKVVDKNGDRPPEISTYETLVKGRNKALVRFLSPPAEKGKEALMVNESMWIFTPGSSNPVKVSSRHRVAGNASYGDLARLNFIDNYDPKFERRDKFKGKDVLILSLFAIQGKQIIYDRIEYWIDAKSFAPVRIIYMTESGRALKEGLFGDFKMVLGRTRPTKFILINSIKTNQVSEMYLSKTKEANHSDLLFEKQNMGRGTP